MKKRIVCRFISIFLLCGFLTAQTADGNAQRLGDTLIFKAAVFGPSDEIFIWWGHAALIVEDTVTGYARIFDWGIFSYPSDNFLWDFAHNRVRYRCGVWSAQADIDMYTEEDRDIVLYTLDLDAEKKEAVLSFAENNILPENCWYTYHQFRDNCSTRIRELIDMGTGGQFKAQFENTPGRFTFRQHIRRFTWFGPFSDWFLSFLMGQDLDKPTTMWEEMFLPVELGRDITDFRYIDNSGNERKLVAAVEQINKSKNRKPILDAPRSQLPRNLAAGIALAVFFALIIVFQKKHPVGVRILRGISQSAAGLFFGIAGTVLIFAAFFADNDYMRHNINMLFVNPLLFAAVPLGICEASGKKFRLPPEKCLRILWTYVLIAGIATIPLKLLPWFCQQNQPVLAVVLPVAFVLSEVWGQRKKDAVK